MSVVPGSLETDAQPPMTVPLRHFVVALGFLVAGVLAGLANALGLNAGLLTLAHVHLLLVGWVCVTIMGAMTQFVPVWSGVTLHDRRLAVAQLWLVTVGLAGFAAVLALGALALAPIFGAILLLGFWLFVYNVGRTLAAVDGLDVTERHFAIALGFFLLVTLLGLALAIDFVHPLFAGTPIDRGGVVGAHATLAVFGAVLTTVVGALYQLATMFTQTELHGIDVPLRRLEEVGYPVGVLVLAAGRLVGSALTARVGAVLVLAGLLATSVILARRLHETKVPWTPMLSRYAVVALALAAWALFALPAWLRDPLAPTARFGAPGTQHLLALGVVGFVVLGTLYHVVPFIVWVHEYSDRLGFEDVPMIDDLYSDLLARIDLVLLLGGGGTLVLADGLGLGIAVASVAGAMVVAGTVVFASNLLAVLRRHSPHTLGGIVLPALARQFDGRGGQSAAPPDQKAGPDSPTGQRPGDGSTSTSKTE